MHGVAKLCYTVTSQPTNTTQIYTLQVWPNVQSIQGTHTHVYSQVTLWGHMKRFDFQSWEGGPDGMLHAWSCNQMTVNECQLRDSWV